MATSDIAQNLASMGRNGDSMLMHVQPREVAGLQALAQANGTSLTTNPDTGMPEAFNLGGVLGAIAPIAAGAFLGPAGAGIGGGFFTGTNAALMSGLTVGALTTALSGGDLGKGLMAGMGAYGGAGLGGTLAKAGQGVTDSVQKTAFDQAANLKASGAIPVQPAMPTTPVGQGGMNFGQGFADAGTSIGTNIGPDMGQVIKPQTGFQNAMTGVQNLPTEAGFQAFKDAGGSGGQLAMMGGSALLGGLEEKDIYGKPLRAPNDEYDPYARLNLGGASSQGESGLRLLAAGGPVSFAQGGSPALQGGGSGAMQGADPIRVSVSGTSSSSAQPWGGSGLWGSYNRIGFGPSVAPEELGLFADQSMIDAARERQNNALRNQTNLGMYGGMGGMNQPYRGMSGINQGYTGMGGIGGLMGRSSTGNADSIDSLNLDKQVSIKLATGGTIGTGGMNDLYAQADNAPAPALTADGYGMGRLDRLSRTSADASASNYQFAQGGYLDGAGDGMSDSIPATIEGKQPARLADGEFVIPADVVSHLGNGSTKAGAKQLYKMLDKIRSARTGTKKQGKQINPSKFMPA